MYEGGLTGGSEKNLCVDAKLLNPTLTERLTYEKANLESRLAEINSVLEALRKQPEVQSLLDAIQKVSRIY